MRAGRAGWSAGVEGGGRGAVSSRDGCYGNETRPRARYYNEGDTYGSGSREASLFGGSMSLSSEET